jgi:hypothetical protein
MLNDLKYPVLLLTVIFTLSCNHNQSAKESKEMSESECTYAVSSRADVDNLAAFISGMPYGKNECYSRIDSIVNWRNFSTELDSLFSFGNRLRINKMKNWADSELVRDSSITILFYPFSGPDFLNADIFYPNVNQYILIGLEPIGDLPDICNMAPDSVISYLNSVHIVFKDILIRSYFITSRMKNDLKKTKINGIIPLISLFIERTGHHIVSIQMIGVDSLGSCHVIDSLKNQKNIVKGVRIDFKMNSTGKVQSVFYFRADLSNKGLKENPGFSNYISKLPKSYTFLKSAAFLLPYYNFKIIRNLIFDISFTILQDDSGIAYRHFDKSKWNIRLYGRFSRPKNELTYVKERDLAAAFRHSIAKPLPFSLGYNYGTNHTSLVYAIKK